MGIVRHLPHWLGGSGPRIRVCDFVPPDHYLRLWADTFPWAGMVEAVERSISRRFPVSTRVLLALEAFLKPLHSRYYLKKRDPWCQIQV